MIPKPPTTPRTRAHHRALDAGHRALSTSHSSRALTLVEVLLSVALLGLAIGVVMSAVSSIAGMEGNGRKRLAAFEVANRLMLQYLDDPKQMPDKNLAIEYGDKKFYWELDETPAVMKVNRRQEAAGNLQALDRFKLIVVTVYDQDLNEAGSNTATVGEPLALLSRAIDPFAPRNPDSLDTYEKDQSKITEMIRSLVGGAAAGTGSSRTQGRQLR